MIIEKEIEAVKLSPTKKDFYQIWNELLDTAKKISDRWDPTSTNEADPGIVLLKVLTAVADKLFYNIDKNILEAFMPSVTQEESMRKLCDMLGYSMKYYQSATTPITVTFTGDASKLSTNNKFIIPKYTVVTNIDNDISYILTQPIEFMDPNNVTKQVEAIEGMYETCKVNGNEIITINNLDDNNRFYFPETQIAENGIFVHNVLYTQKINQTTQAVETITEEGTAWEAVDNLNTQKINSKVFKFGYDSKEKLPYIQFSEDVANLIEDGLFISYVRTNGVNGNIAARTINKFQTIDDIQTVNLEDIDLENELVVTNASNAINGTNKETINAAYNNYKRTIGTFDTLVTCRDYMNKIYQMMKKDLAPEISMDTTPLVSNIIVSDIRDDINSSYTLCTLDNYGINYVDMTKAVIKDEQEVPLINNFDLVLYPFTVITNTALKSEYDNSFKYSSINISNISTLLEENKTISHVIKNPNDDDIACIKVYLRLNAKITTTYKVSQAEESAILKNIYRSIYDAFNMRQLDFGEEIPYDSILDVIKNADSRIKNISLDEPTPYVTVRLVDNTKKEIKLTDTNDTMAKKIYNNLALRNILAGKIALFDYNESFKSDLTEAKVPYTGSSTEDYSDVYFPLDTGTETGTRITNLITSFELPLSALPYTLQDNEVIQFRAPNLKTIITYPAYVNYYLHLVRDSSASAEDYTIKKNTEYQLKDNEYLFINYTPASDDGDDATSISKPYYAGTIIKFNFDCQDSQYHREHSYDAWSKQSGFSFNIEGMYTFGVNEQVEIRDFAIVTLGGTESAAYAYVYWQRNDDNKYPNKTSVSFEWNEDPVDPDDPDTKYLSYTLKEGEYFYYTDNNKLDIAMYGNGTKITRSKTTIELTKDKANESLTSEDILMQGLAAAIPWISLEVDRNKYINIQEFQYITLTAEDKLISVNPLDNDYITILDNINNKQVIDAEYKFSTKESSETLPKFNFSNDNSYWEVTPKLDLNVGPTKTQTLYTYDKITAIGINNIDSSEYTKDFIGTDLGLALKTNYPVTSSSKNTSVTVWKTDPVTGSLTDTESDFTVKVFTNKETKISNMIHNFSTNLSKISIADFSDYRDSSESPDINKTTGLIESIYTLIPQNNFGLIMIYCLPGAEDTDKGEVGLEFRKTTEEAVAGTIFNYPSSDAETWWGNEYIDTDSDTGITRYILRSGINIIKIPAEVSRVLIYSTKKDTNTNYYIKSDDIITISDLDIIPYTVYNPEKAINPKLDYKVTTESNIYTQVLKDINVLDKDHKFYYNALLDNSNIIDLNENNDTETLSNPYTWYNYNNVNNKFVITEIDSDYLSTGITIAKSSKL